ncbi:TetR/AcrR family transcriptional regulator [Micromonospora sp. WMMD812]|uniref:TetR/AcrR family transcriptional regulator n=1 Tax=Micromonospora sp. WMMD812 TaxID=3015152 RepID=UPI00248B55AB|nr:TetR/AcrR family transcriptional regulator [Micromonospora sp. WMMD812]WBB69964.1 TetR/AcrR family transcriptional regulator [Micromonospora sp. WMMD812]
MPASGGRRRPTKGDQRERALLDAARELLRHKPLAQLTIDEVSAAAGITRSGFYFYFESKHALLAELYSETLGVSEQEMSEWVESDQLDRAALRRGFAKGLRRWKIDGRWLSEAFLNPDPGPEVLAVREKIIGSGCMVMERRIERDARANRTVPADPKLLSLMVVNLRLSMFAQAYSHPEEQSDDELLDALTDASLRMLYGVLPPDLAAAADDRASGTDSSR